MKRFFTFLCAALVVLSVNALPVKKAESLKQVKAEQIVKAGKVDAPRSLDATSSVARKAKKAESDYVVITEQPAGELKTYGRGGGHYYVSSQSLYYENQSGTIDVVFGSGDKVYFKDIVSGLAYGTWVEGTFNAAKDTVLVPLGQNLRYVSTYDACIAIQLLQYVSGSGFSVVTTETEIAFAYDAANDIFELQGTAFADVSLAGVWTDDGTIQNYGDYESVYSPYEAPELVVLPDGATVEEYTMDFLTSNGVNDALIVGVAVVEDSVYIQGLSSYIPDAWVKGIKEGNTVTFAADQLLGEYAGYTSYFFYHADGVFTYDPAEDTYTAADLVYGVIAEQYYDGYYDAAVLRKGARTIDFSNPIEVALVSASHKYNSSDEDVIYTLSTAAGDTTFVFDIDLEGTGLEDIEDGVTYSENDMYGANYTNVTIGDEAFGFWSIEFSKTLDGAGVPHFEGTVADCKARVFHFSFSAVEEVVEPITVPDDLETASYSFKAHDPFFDEDVAKFVQVGFVADTVYIQGISYYLPDAWIKGIKNGDDYDFAACFLGTFTSWGSDVELTLDPVTMAYDAALDQFTCDALTSSSSDGYAWDEFENVVITRFTEVAATPADPEITNFVVADVTYPKVEFNIPLIGTEGEELNPSKLSYVFFTDIAGAIDTLVLDPSEYTELTAPMTEIPYEFSDNWDIYNYRLYLNQDKAEIRTWSKLGLQVIYRGLGEEHKSNIVWYDVAAYWAEIDGPAEGIEETLAEGKAVKVVRDNQIIILKGDKAFNAVGNRVK